MPPAPSRARTAPSRPPRAAVPRALASMLLAAAVALLPARLHAQTYARFAVPDSALADALRGSGGGFEAAWNALVVSTLRARLAGADSAARLAALAGRVAQAEPAALGSRVAGDAWALWRRATPAAERQRVRAAVRESLGVAALAARDFANAESLDVAALADYRALGDRRRAAWLMGSLGVVRFQSADYAGAERAYREALDARRALGDPRMIGATLNALGSTTFQARASAPRSARR